MKTASYIILTFVFLIFACKENDQVNTSSASITNYSKVPFNKVLEFLKGRQINMHQIAYKDSLGNDLTDSTRRMLNEGKLRSEFYWNSKQEVVQIRLHRLQENDIFKEIQIRELLTNPFSKINFIEIDCTEVDSLLLDALEKDQNMRKGIDVGISDVDARNQDVVISIIENCGWPDRAELIESIWYVIQHADSGLMAYYYPKFKEMVSKGLLEARTMALMEDRMLMNNGFPQIYGSQVVKKSVYKFRDPININKRREEIGLPPMEEYTRRFGFEFNLEEYLQDE